MRLSETSHLVAHRSIIESVEGESHLRKMQGHAYTFEASFDKPHLNKLAALIKVKVPKFLLQLFKENPKGKIAHLVFLSPSVLKTFHEIHYIFQSVFTVYHKPPRSLINTEKNSLVKRF